MVTPDKAACGRAPALMPTSSTKQIMYVQMHNHIHMYASPKTLTNSLKSMQPFSSRYQNIQLKQSFIVSSTHSNLCHKGLASFDQI